MALVNPNIAMSFRQPEFQPRNALAEYAQVQQIVGGQRQAEMADMQMEELRRERDALGRIQAAIVAKGGPPDLGAAADEMIRTGRPQFVTQGMAIRESLKKQRYFEEFESRFGAGRAAPSAAAAAGANAMAAPAGELVAAPMPSPTGTVRDIAPAGAPGAASRAVFNQDAIAGIDPEAQKSISLILDDAAQLRAKADEFRGSVRASGFLSQAEQLENQAASMLAVQKRRAGESRFDTGAPATAEQVNAARQALAVGQAPVTNTLAPAAAPVTNAMLAPAAQPAVPPADINQLAAAGAGPNIDDLMARYDLAAKAGHPMAPAILKQIEAALRGDQNRPMAVSRGQVVIDPRTGRQIFSAPETTTLSDRFVPVGRLVFDRQTEQFISPTQAQLAQSQELASTAAPGARAPLGYRFTPAGDLEPIPGGPAARVAGAGAAPGAAAPSQRAPAGYRFTPTGDLEPIPGGPASPGLSPKDIQKREAVYPQATQSVNGFTTKSDQFIAELERLRDDPGLNQITGPIYGRTPSVSREGSRAQALYDKIFAKGGFQALQDMREASKTGGALGNVSNEEGRRLEKSIVGGLDRTQNIADVQKGINDLIDEIRTSQARVREAYDTTYEYRAQRGAGGGGSAPAAGAARQLSPQDKQALDWANSNPTDPRAAQIKARLGVRQ